MITIFSILRGSDQCEGYKIQFRRLIDSELQTAMSRPNAQLHIHENKVFDHMNYNFTTMKEFHRTSNVNVV